MKSMFLSCLLLLVTITMGCETQQAVFEGEDDLHVPLQVTTTPSPLVGTMAWPDSLPSLAVAQLNPQTGQVMLFEDRLRTTFADGGPINHLTINKRVEAEYDLVRIGKDAEGNCRTESYQLRLHHRYLVPKLEVKWYKTCGSPDCYGICSLDKWSNTCSCNGVGTCVFGMDVIDLDVIYIDGTI